MRFRQVASQGLVLLGCFILDQCEIQSDIRSSDSHLFTDGAQRGLELVLSMIN